VNTRPSPTARADNAFHSITYPLSTSPSHGITECEWQCDVTLTHYDLQQQYTIFLSVQCIRQANYD